MHTGIHLKDDIDLKIDRIKFSICEHFKYSKTPLQSLISLRSSFACSSLTCIFDMFVSFVNKAESISPYAGDILVSLLEKELGEQAPATFMSQHLPEILSGDHQEMLKYAIELTGLHGKIVINKNVVGKNYVELTNSYVFDNLNSTFKLLEKEYLDAKLICIDGYVENVSEIHRLLEQASSTKDNVFLFVRGLSDDVNHTLKVNYDRKTLCVIPVVVPFDLEGVNIMNDIAIICNNDVVSSNKGQLINCVDINEFNRVENIKINQDKVLITHKDSYSRVNKHISFLQEKIHVSPEATGDILSKRIQRLGTTQVVISLPDEKDFSAQSFSLDRRIRSIKKSVDHGVVRINGKLYPFSSYQTARMLKEKLLFSVKDIGCIID